MPEMESRPLWGSVSPDLPCRVGRRCLFNPMRILVVLAVLLGVCGGLHLHSGPRRAMGRRASARRLGRAFVRAAADGEKEGEEDGGFLKELFTTNRDSPEARANQLEWAREQMALEVPDATLSGDKISDRDDL